MRIIVGADRVQEFTGCHKASFGDITLSDNHLPGIGDNLIRIDLKITENTIDLYSLVDIPLDDPIVISFLR